MGLERKKKASKNKDIINNIIKEEGINKSLSTNEKNKLILKAISTSSDDIEEVSDKKEEQTKTSIREFKCQCGFIVRLEGDIAKEKIDKCSVCRSK